MLLGIISDLHSNSAGLTAALERMGDVDLLLCAGDMIEDYRFSNEVCEILREREAICVLGNHDLGLLAPSGTRAREAPHVRAGNVAWLATHPLEVSLDIAGKKLLMTHASPCPPNTQYVYPHSPELPRLAEVDADYIVLGHTHVQMARTVGRALVVNPGSAGEARDHANGRRLSYAVLDTTTDEVRFEDYDQVWPTP